MAAGGLVIVRQKIDQPAKRIKHPNLDAPAVWKLVAYFHRGVEGIRIALNFE